MLSGGLQVNNYSKKNRKGEIGKVKKICRSLSSKNSNFYFCARPSKTCSKLNVSRKKGMLSCRLNAFFEQIGANMAHIVAENVQKMSKKCVLRKSSRSEWVKPKLTSRQVKTVSGFMPKRNDVSMKYNSDIYLHS